MQEMEGTFMFLINNAGKAYGQEEYAKYR
jgi:hypothetical protein